MVEKLIQMRTKVNHADHHDITALFYAAAAARADIVRRLLRAGADPDVRMELGLTPADCARARTRENVAFVEVLELLSGSNRSRRTSNQDFEPGSRGSMNQRDGRRDPSWAGRPESRINKERYRDFDQRRYEGRRGRDWRESRDSHHSGLPRRMEARRWSWSQWFGRHPR